MSTQQQPPYPLRMPEEMRKRIEELAKENGRSVNAEILAHLQRSLDNQAIPLGLDALADQLAEKIAQRLKDK